MKTVSNKRAFTLTELIATMVMAVIVTLSTGLVLFDSQRGWHRMYDRVYSDVVTDGYVAGGAFSSTVRRSSIKRHRLGETGDFVELYYYQDADSTELDGYARFYTSGGQLVVGHGELDKDTAEPLPASNTVTLASNVKTANFSVTGASVQMVLRLDNGSEAMTVTCSAVRHSK